MVFTVVSETYKLIWGSKSCDIEKYVWRFEPESLVNIDEKLQTYKHTFRRNNSLLMFCWLFSQIWWYIPSFLGMGGSQKTPKIEKYVWFACVLSTKYGFTYMDTRPQKSRKVRIDQLTCMFVCKTVFARCVPTILRIHTNIHKNVSIHAKNCFWKIHVVVRW